MVVNAFVSTVSGGGLRKRPCLKGFKGFTLAEVLITLVIIGIIAAMTIPTLINKTNKQEYVSRLKKTYSTLAQATAKIVAEEGSSEHWADTKAHILEHYKKHLSGVKVCNVGADCFNGAGMKYLDTDTYDYAWQDVSKGLILADGTQLLFTVVTNGVEPPFPVVIADINGNKGPNMYGRDGFWFLIKEYNIVPQGDGQSMCPGNYQGNRGKGCAAKVLIENAMNY